MAGLAEVLTVISMINLPVSGPERPEIKQQQIDFKRQVDKLSALALS